MKINKSLLEKIDEIGDNHQSINKETPIRLDAFNISKEQKIILIEEKIRDILEVLGMDLTDDSLVGTPKRVAKMYVNELFGGLMPENRPKASSFKNKYKYGEMLVEKNITLYSTCEHHLLPIIGKAHVAYISNGTVIGLSKINRIVDYFAKDPKSERLTLQIVDEMQKILNTKSVACVIDTKHLCVNSRGIADITTNAVTCEFDGNSKAVKREFLDYINLDTEL